MVRRRDRAGLQHHPRRERRPAASRQPRRGREPSRPSAARSPRTAAAFGQISRVLERRRAGRTPDRRRLSVPGEVTMASLVAATLIQWLALTSLVMLIGSAALDLFVLPST